MPTISIHESKKVTRLTLKSNCGFADVFEQSRAFQIVPGSFQFF